MLAGVECLMHLTEYAGHAHEIVANMSLQDLEAIDGILAVCLNTFVHSFPSISVAARKSVSAIFFI